MKYLSRYDHNNTLDEFKVIFHANISLQQIVVPDPQVWPMVLIFINTPPNSSGNISGFGR